MNGQPIQLRKYANRRYYDVTRRQHVTLDAIHRLILDGHDVAVSDAKTGEDITGRVLAQIILERDPPKLSLLPAAFWHQVLRANVPLVREFVEKYFSQALTAFLDSQRQLESQLRGVMGLDHGNAALNPWLRMMLGPFALNGPPQNTPTDGTAAAPPSSTTGGEVNSELLERITRLQQQVDALREQRARA
jgi:polyhydroxyalkanoate synthesis repressor PhaR